MLTLLLACASGGAPIDVTHGTDTKVPPGTTPTETTGTTPTGTTPDTTDTTDTTEDGAAN